MADNTEHDDRQPVLKTPTQAAAYLGVSERTIRRYIKAGKLGTLDIDGATRIQPADLDKLINLTGHTPTLSGTAEGDTGQALSDKSEALRDRIEQMLRDQIRDLQAENARLWDLTRSMLPAPRNTDTPRHGVAWYWLLAAAIVALGIGGAAVWLWLNW